jgi:D-threo-aldose 1-dehydrogenase
MRNWRDKRGLGQTQLMVTGICAGAGMVSSMTPSGFSSAEKQGVATVDAVFGGPFNMLDSSNAYGKGKSEHTIGLAIKQRGGATPAGFVLDTKVDADPQTRDFSGDRVRRSVEESFERLGITSCDLMYLHDPEYYLTFKEAMLPGGPVAALVKLRDEGVLRNIGVAAGPTPMMLDYLGIGLFSVMLSHNRFTLLDRSAEPLMDEAAKRGVSYVNAAPYGGGMLAKGPTAQPNYRYRESPGAVQKAAREMEAECAKAGVPLAAAALQFSLRDPRVTTTVVGMTHPDRIAETVALADHPIPDDLWGKLLALTPSAWLD